MRISTATRYDTSVENLQSRQIDLAASQTQLTSGKRVNVASDDPVAAARAERDLATMARSDANQRALEASRNAVQLGESAIGDASELIQQARETLVAAGNGSYTPAERQSQAIKLKEIRNQLLTVAAGDNTLRLVPPLVIGDAEIDEFFDKLSAGAASFQPPEAVA